MKKVVQNQQHRLFIVCVYTEFNQQVQCLAYVKYFSKNTFHPYVQFQALDMFLPKKQLPDKFNIMSMRVNNIGLHFLPFFQITGK